MTAAAYFSEARNLQRVHEGPLGDYIDPYASRLVREGYRRPTAWRCLRLIADLSRWLDLRQLGVSDLDEALVACYLASRAGHRRPQKGDRPTLTGCWRFSARPPRSPLLCQQSRAPPNRSSAVLPVIWLGSEASFASRSFIIGRLFGYSFRRPASGRLKISQSSIRPSLLVSSSAMRGTTVRRQPRACAGRSGRSCGTCN